MIKLLGPKVNSDRKIEEEKSNPAPSSSNKISPGLIRLQKELGSIDIPTNAKLEFKSKGDITNFDVIVRPEEGSYWYGATYTFTVTVPPEYPFEPPKISCNTKIYHPNIDLNGKVCLNILRQDWKPVLDVNNVILGLLFLFIEPNPNDPLNEEAAKQMRDDKKGFSEIVKKTLKGQSYNGVTFPKLI